MSIIILTPPPKHPASTVADPALDANDAMTRHEFATPEEAIAFLEDYADDAD